VQQQQHKIATQVHSINVQAMEILGLKQQQLRMQQQVAELKDLNRATLAVLQKLQTKDEFVAQR
jgi:uncharacterized protein YdcH (DUF465 family)